MWIKICGNTNLKDARLAAELGADAVGFVFAPSARQVTPAQAAQIVPHLPKHVEKVGVFSSTDPKEIIATVVESGLTGVQLHSSFDRELVRMLHAQFNEEITLVQTVHWVLDEDETPNASRIAAELKAIAEEPAVARVLIDSKTTDVSGGTGRTFPWSEASAELKAAGELKIIAAGGLHSGNVAQAIQEMKPWGVDVASGVEASKGRKDAAKLKNFIDAVRSFRGGD